MSSSSTGFQKPDLVIACQSPVTCKQYCQLLIHRRSFFQSLSQLAVKARDWITKRIYRAWGGSINKWRYPKMVGLWRKILFKLMIFWGTPMSRNLHVCSTPPPKKRPMLSHAFSRILVYVSNFGGCCSDKDFLAASDQRTLNCTTKSKVYHQATTGECRELQQWEFHQQNHVFPTKDSGCTNWACLWKYSESKIAIYIYGK